VENFQKLKLNNLLYGPINDLNNLKFINLEDESRADDAEKVLNYAGAVEIKKA